MPVSSEVGCRCQPHSVCASLPSAADKKEPHRLVVVVNHKTMTVPNRHRGEGISDTTMLPEGIVRMLKNAAVVHPIDEVIDGVTTWLRDAPPA